MYEILYRSKAISTLSVWSLESLITQARRANLREQITGFMIFDGTHFLQIFEGQRETVERLFRNIQSDDRHTDIEPIWSQSSSLKETRSFSNWSMGSIKIKSGMLTSHRAFQCIQDNNIADQPSHGARLFKLLVSNRQFGAKGIFMPCQIGQGMDLSVRN